MIRHHRGSGFDLQLAVGEGAQGRLEGILAAEGDTVEVKRECEKYPDTENIALEFKQSDGNGGTKPSGIHPNSTTADWWAIEFLPDRWLIMRTAELREIGRIEYSISGEVKMGDNGNVGVLVPLTSLIDPFLLKPSERMCSTCRREAKTACSSA